MNALLSKKNNIIRVGDLVRIVNPEMYVRCGYPWDKQYAIKNLIDISEKLDLLDLLCIDYELDRFGEDFEITDTNHYKSRAYEKMLDQLAYLKLIQNGFGGSSRKIITARDETKLGLECVVHKKFYKHSGEHDGSGGLNFLSKLKVHKILEIIPTSGNSFWLGDIRIEDVNVVKLL